MPVDDWRERRRGFYLKTDILLPDGLLRQLAALNVRDALERCAGLASASARVLNEPIVSVTPCQNQGTFHLVHEVLLSDGARLVARSSSSRVFCSDSSFFLDAWAQARMPSLGLPSLTVLHVDTSQDILPFPWMLVETAPGRCLASLSDDELDNSTVLQETGQALRKLHEVEAQKYGPVEARLLGNGEPPTGPFERWSDYIFNCLEEHLAAAVKCGFLDPRECINVFRAMQDRRELIDQMPSRFLHGDPGNQNIFFRSMNVSALIDWEDAVCGDPLYDVAFWASFHPSRRWKSFFSGYGTSLTEERDAIRFALYYTRITLAKILHRRRFGYADRPGRPTSRARMQEAIGMLLNANISSIHERFIAR